MSDDHKVIEGVELKGKQNVDEETLLENIRYAIRQHHPQVRRQAPQMDRICLVGGGPSLTATEPELVQLLHEGAKLVTVNGSYHWALSRNLRPQTQVIIDARPGNERFLDPPVPGCNYLISSQCAPSVWDAVANRERVWVFHTVLRDFTAAAELLDQHYFKRWESVNGGTTVASRALYALRILGYLRYDIFGVDCCWDAEGKLHHAYPQPENEKDKRYNVTIAPGDAPDRSRTFYCSGWHLKQYEDFLQIIRAVGQQFLLNFHGDGMLAYTLATNADLSDAVITEECEDGSSGLEGLQQSKEEDRQRDDQPVGDDLADCPVPVGR